MKSEKSILFGTDMVRAILDGNKTQTRRPIRPQPGRLQSVFGPDYYLNKSGIWIAGMKEDALLSAPYYPGQKLWVRETWQELKDLDLAPSDDPPQFIYKADRGPWKEEYDGFKWKPSIHMPKRAARVWLKVTNVRVERLKDITDEEARKEGITDGGCEECGEPEPCGCDNPSPIPHDAFYGLWMDTYGEGLEGPYSFLRNPWVWVIEFKVIDQ